MHEELDLHVLVVRKKWVFQMATITLNDDLESSKREYDRAAKGMRHPQIITLQAGDEIFRFASTKNPQTGTDLSPDQWIRGAWWFAEADYRLIIERYLRGKMSLGTVARSAGAIQPSWSLMNVSIKARVIQPIKVYQGKGSTQYRDELPNGMYVTLTGWPDIQQLYIPDMRGNALTALQIVRKKIISTDSFGF